MSTETENNVVDLLQFRRDRIRRRTMQNAVEEDDRNIYYMGASITDIARLGALNADLSCDISDPRNAKYRVPLADPADEDYRHVTWRVSVSVRSPSCTLMKQNSMAIRHMNNASSMRAACRLTPNISASSEGVDLPLHKYGATNDAFDDSHVTKLRSEKYA